MFCLFHRWLLYLLKFLSAVMVEVEPCQDCKLFALIYSDLSSWVLLLTVQSSCLLQTRVNQKHLWISTIIVLVSMDFLKSMLVGYCMLLLFASFAAPHFCYMSPLATQHTFKSFFDRIYWLGPQHCLLPLLLSTLPFLDISPLKTLGSNI